MKIFLRILVLVLLVLSGVSLYFGILLFLQREQLKARTNMLEETVVALSLEVEKEKSPEIEDQDLPKISIIKNDIKRYYKLNAIGEPELRTNAVTGELEKIIEGEGTMDFVLKDFQTRIVKQKDRLNETRGKLTKTREQLELTQLNLRNKKADLKVAYSDIRNLKETIIDRDEQLSQKEIEIDNANATITELRDTITEKDDLITKHETKITELEDHIKVQDRYIEELKAEIERLRKEETDAINPGVGRKGTIKSVNAAWSFVVISIDKGIKLPRNTNLLVLRQKKLVAKVRIVKVKDQDGIAIAEILPDWLQMPIQKGDVATYAQLF